MTTAPIPDDVATDRRLLEEALVRYGFLPALARAMAVTYSTAHEWCRYRSDYGWRGLPKLARRWLQLHLHGTPLPVAGDPWHQPEEAT